MKTISKQMIFAMAAVLPFFLAGEAAAKKAPASRVSHSLKSGDVEAIEAVYHSLSDLSARFTQTTQVKLVGREIKRQGTFRFKKGGMWKIEYEGSGGRGSHPSRAQGGDVHAKHYVADGTTLWIYIPGDPASLQTFAVNDETVPKEALSFLSGFGKLKKEFAVSKSDAFSNASSGKTALHLIPRSGTKHYESIDALFGPDHLLTELIVKNTSGNVSHYRFSEIKTNQGLSEDIFTLSSGKATPDMLPE